MDSIQKFYSDIEKIKKHNRNQDGVLDLQKTTDAIISLFEQNNRGLCDLPHSLCEHWVKTYVNPEIDSGSQDLSRETIEKLCAMQAFLEGSDETDCLDSNDWHEIADAVNYEAEDLPMDLLSQMMMTIVDKRAL